MNKFVKYSLIGVATLFGGCTVLGVIGAAASNSAPAATTAPAAVLQAPPQVSWLGSVTANCAAYEGAPNEIKKSAIFRANQDLLEAAKIESARGTLGRISTNQGGSELQLTIKIGDAEFRSSNRISKGTPVYEAAAEMQQGDCVLFSAHGVESTSIFEHAQVCDTDYRVDFTFLKACK